MFAPDDVAAGVALRRVLLVEDDDVAAGALSQILGHFKCQVVIVDSVSAAMRELAARPFDHAILDLMLPDGSGGDVLAEIRARGLPIRVVVTTASSDRDLIAKTKSRNPDAFLAKPLDIGKLLGAMGI